MHVRPYLLSAVFASSTLAGSALSQPAAPTARAASVVFVSGLDEPRSVAQLADGRVLVAETDLDVVLAFSADGVPLGVFGAADDPDDIHQLADGRVLVAEFNTGKVLAFGADGTPLGTFATGLDHPLGITQLVNGTVLVAENYTPGARAFTTGGVDLGPYVTSITGEGAAYGVRQLADGRILLTTLQQQQMHFDQTVQAFSADGIYMGAFAGREHLDSPDDLVQLADGRVLIIDRAFGLGHVEAFDTEGTWLGTFAEIPGFLPDLTQLADGRVLVTDGDTKVYAFDPTTTATAPLPEGAGLALSIAPNPARGSVVVTLTLDGPGAASVIVYDVLGRKMAVLHDGPLAAGTNSLRLDVTGLPPGVYVVRAAANRSAASQRITVLR